MLVAVDAQEQVCRYIFSYFGASCLLPKPLECLSDSDFSGEREGQVLEITREVDGEGICPLQKVAFFFLTVVKNRSLIPRSFADSKRFL